MSQELLDGDFAIAATEIAGVPHVRLLYRAGDRVHEAFHTRETFLDLMFPSLPTPYRPGILMGNHTSVWFTDPAEVLALTGEAARCGEMAFVRKGGPLLHRKSGEANESWLRRCHAFFQEHKDNT